METPELDTLIGVAQRLFPGFAAWANERPAEAWTEHKRLWLKALRHHSLETGVAVVENWHSDGLPESLTFGRWESLAAEVRRTAARLDTRPRGGDAAPEPLPTDDGPLHADSRPWPHSHKDYTDAGLVLASRQHFPPEPRPARMSREELRDWEARKRAWDAELRIAYDGLLGPGWTVPGPIPADLLEEVARYRRLKAQSQPGESGRDLLRRLRAAQNPVSGPPAAAAVSAAPERPKALSGPQGGSDALPPDAPPWEVDDAAAEPVAAPAAEPRDAKPEPDGELPF